MPLPEKYRYLEQQSAAPKKRDAAQIRAEGQAFSTMLKIVGALVFVLFLAFMALIAYHIAGLSEFGGR